MWLLTLTLHYYISSLILIYNRTNFLSFTVEQQMTLLSQFIEKGFKKNKIFGTQWSGTLPLNKTKSSCTRLQGCWQFSLTLGMRFCFENKCVSVDLTFWGLLHRELLFNIMSNCYSRLHNHKTWNATVRWNLELNNKTMHIVTMLHANKNFHLNISIINVTFLIWQVGIPPSSLFYGM